MKQSITLDKVTKFVGFGALKPLGSFFKGKLEKEDLTAFLKKVLVPLASIILFIGLWHTGAKALYNMEATYKIETALNDQGQAEADAMKACIASGDISCQPNTLPSPTQVWTSYKSLLKDHAIISADKKAFKEKTAVILL